MNAPLRNHLQVCRNRKVSIYVIAMQGKFTEIHYHSGFIKKKISLYNMGHIQQVRLVKISRHQIPVTFKG